MSVWSAARHLALRLFAPGALIRRKYEAFKSLLDFDRRGHELMARLEGFYHGETSVDFNVAIKDCRELFEAISGLIGRLDTMSPSSYRDLAGVLSRIEWTLKPLLELPPLSDEPAPLVLPLDEARDRSLSGGKSANLAAVRSMLKLPVPEGFVLTSAAFRLFIDQNGLAPKIESLLAELDIRSASSVESISEELMGLVLASPLPSALTGALDRGYAKLAQACSNGNLSVAVRSSGVGEDSNLSFAGQYITVLGVEREGLEEAYRTVLASRYSPEALV
ncbi:MAG: PEP/pyruvate-binding domain-containing protein, partial [Acidobacteriota bacterium]